MEYKSPFANPYLSPEDQPASQWAAKAATVIGSNPVIRRMSVEEIRSSLEHAAAALQAREEKVKALDALVSNMAAMSFLQGGSGGQVHDLALRLEAEAAMARYLRKAVAGLRSYLADREAEAAKPLKEAA